MGAGGADGAIGEERLKAEFMGGDAIGGEDILGAGAGAEGIDKSRRSFMPEAGAAGFDGAVEANAEKLPKPLEGLVVRFAACAAGGDLGLESKKLPPPPNMFDVDVVGGDLALEKLSRPEKGEGLGAGAALKERLLKASFIPPKADGGGDVCAWASPPKDS